MKHAILKKRIIAIPMAISMCIQPSLLNFGTTASEPLVLSSTEAYQNALDPAGKILAKAMTSAYKLIAVDLEDKVAKITQPMVDQMGKQLIAQLDSDEGIWTTVQYQTPTLDAILSSIPPAPLLAMIPPAQLEAVKGVAQQEVEKAIVEGFEQTSATVQENVKLEMAKLVPKFINQFKPQVKVMINQVGDLIDEEVSQSIDAQLEDQIAEVMNQLPEKMREMTPEEIADQYAKQLIPVAESAMRPELEAAVKRVMASQVQNLIENPLNELIENRLNSISIESYSSLVDQIPESAFTFVSREFVKTIVDLRIQELKADLPEMVKAQQVGMRTAIAKEIDTFVDQSSKTYVNNILVNMPFRIQKNRVFVKGIDLMASLQISMTFDTVKKTITLKKGTTVIVMTIGSDKVYVNGKLSSTKLSPDMKPYMDGKSPMIPLERLSTLLGLGLDYNPEWKVLEIDKKK